jgi:hypothetical protein
MARWRLSTSHYLSVENNEWEYNETDRSSGKQIRTRLKVPLQLDIDDPACWNVQYRNQRGEIVAGEIVVAHSNTEHKADDILFIGDPTPDMIPLDDEAKAISKTFEKRWGAAPNEDISYGQKMIEASQAEMAKVQAAANVVKIEGMAEIMKTMTDMLAMNQAMMAQMVANQPKVDRRV